MSPWLTRVTCTIISCNVVLFISSTSVLVNSLWTEIKTLDNCFNSNVRLLDQLSDLQTKRIIYKSMYTSNATLPPLLTKQRCWVYGCILWSIYNCISIMSKLYSYRSGYKLTICNHVHICNVICLLKVEDSTEISVMPKTTNKRAAIHLLRRPDDATNSHWT